MNPGNSSTNLALFNSYAALFDKDPSKYLYPDTGATVTCVNNDKELINEQPTPNGLKIRTCSNDILQNTVTGELPIKELPQEVRKTHQVYDININLLSVETTCM